MVEYPPNGRRCAGSHPRRPSAAGAVETSCSILGKVLHMKITIIALALALAGTLAANCALLLAQR